MMKRISSLLLLALVLMASSAFAETVSTRMEVSAYVLGRTVGGVTSAPASLVLTAEDVQRGWVEVNEPIALSIRSNQRLGYRLAVLVEGPVKQVELDGLEGDWLIDGSEGWIAMPYRGTNVQELTVHCRIELDAAAAPGTYPFPVQIALAN